MIRYAIGLAVAGLVIVAGAVYVRQVERLCPQSCPCPQSRAVAHKVEMVAYWMDVSSVLGKIVGNFSITPGNRGARPVGAQGGQEGVAEPVVPATGQPRRTRSTRGGGAEVSEFERLGVDLAAPPPAYAGSAAAAFLAAVSSAFRRIRDARRGIRPTPRTRSWR